MPSKRLIVAVVLLVVAQGAGADSGAEPDGRSDYATTIARFESKAQAGDATAAQTVTVWLDLVADVLATVLNVIGATIVPVGGGLSNVAPLVDALDLAVRARVLRRDSGPVLRRAAHQVEPGLIGAAQAGWRGLAHV